jgi:hypothetical protein
VTDSEQLQERLSQSDRLVASPWTPTNVHVIAKGHYRVCFASRAESDARSETIHTSISADERGAETERGDVWGTLHVEPIDPSRGRYDAVEGHAHTAEIRAYRIGGGLNGE